MKLRRLALKIVLPGMLLWLAGQFFILPHFVSATPTATYVSQFGSQDKTFKMWAKDMAYNPVDHKIYTTQSYDLHHVIVYNLDGSFDRKILVTNNDQLQYIDIDPSGNMYVTAGINMVYKFDVNDQLVTSWGTQGTGNGQFQGIGTVRYSSFNNKLYIVDNTDRVQVFDASGNYLSSWAPGITGTRLAISSVDGTVYVAAPSTSNPRVKSFDANGNAITSWGTTGTGDGQFGQGVLGIATDATGKVYVNDFYNNRIEVFQSNGTFINKFGSGGTGDGQFDQAGAVLIVPSGDIYVTDAVSNFNPTDRPNRVEVFDSSYAYKSQFSTIIPAESGKFEDIESMVFGPDGNLYIADTHNYRIQVLDSDGNFIRQWGSQGPGDGQFQFGGALVISNNKVYVLDANYYRVQVFDLNGTFLYKWGSQGTGDGQFQFAEGITADADRNIYIADENNHRIQAFDANGNFLRKWGTQGSGDGQFNYPTSIVYSPVTDHLYVIDSSNYRIEEFDTAGTFIKAWGTQGSGDGQFDYSEYITVDTAGNIYVADSSNNRFQVFDKDGNFITKWGTYGMGGNTQFNYPLSMVVRGSDIYVTDYANWTVQSVRKFSLDLIALAPTVTSPTENEEVIKPFSTVSGIGEVGATVTIQENNSTICTTTVVDSSGVWSCTLSSPIFGTGTQAISVTQTDSSGNVSAATTRTFKIISRPTTSGSVATNGGSSGFINSGTDNNNTQPPTPSNPNTPTNTDSACSMPFTMPARFGSRGDEVSKIQQFLKDKGYYYGRITGYYGMWTELSVKNFQQAYFREILIPLNRIEPTGIWSYSTMGLANRLGCQ